MEETLVELIGKISEVAPHVWEIAVRQAYVEGVRHLVLSAVFLVVCALLVGVTRWAATSDDASDIAPMAFVFGGLGSIVAAAIAVSSVLEAISNLLNPHFAAIRLLLGLAGVK